MAKRLLPIGIQTFRKLRTRNYYYVDKTPYALQLIDEGTHYFLSRPRRFGKSLFLDTLKALFEGRRELFQGLHAHGDWEWSVRRPVVRLDFSGGDFEERGYLRTNLMAQIDSIEEEAGIRTRYDTGPERLADLIRGLYRKSGRGVAVLVDEYGQADPGRIGGAGNRARREPELLARPVCGSQVLRCAGPLLHAHRS